VPECPAELVEHLFADDADVVLFTLIEFMSTPVPTEGGIARGRPEDVGQGPAGIACAGSVEYWLCIGHRSNYDALRPIRCGTAVCESVFRTRESVVNADCGDLIKTFVRG